MSQYLRLQDIDEAWGEEAPGHIASPSRDVTETATYALVQAVLQDDGKVAVPVKITLPRSIDADPVSAIAEVFEAIGGAIDRDKILAHSERVNELWLAWHHYLEADEEKGKTRAAAFELENLLLNVVNSIFTSSAGRAGEVDQYEKWLLEVIEDGKLEDVQAALGRLKKIVKTLQEANYGKSGELLEYLESFVELRIYTSDIKAPQAGENEIWIGLEQITPADPRFQQIRQDLEWGGAYDAVLEYLRAELASAVS